MLLKCKKFGVVLCLSIVSFCSLDARRALGQHAPVAQISFELVGEHLVVPIEVAGHEGPLNFVFDTGAGATVFDAAMAKEIGLKPDHTLNAQGAGGTERLEVCLNQGLRVGDSISVQGVPLVLADLTKLREGIGHEIVGITGNDLLSRYLVQIEYGANKIRFFEQEAKLDVSGYTAVPFEFKKGMPIPFVTATIELESGEKLSGDFLLDTGAGLSLAINTPFAKRNDLLGKSSDHFVIESKGLNTKMVNQVIKIESATVFGQRFGEMEISLSDSDAGVSAMDGFMGILGNEIIRRFDMIADYKNKTVYFKPNQSLDEKFKFSLAGLGVIQRDGEILITSVVAGSRAEKLGFKVDDRIVTVDGRSTDQAETVRDWFSDEGKTVTIVVEDESGRRTIELELKRLLDSK